ncbi:hypothetical protein [Sulfurospirillum sp. MES]|uniref:hypothetical protein n=1 Tax=Sulfurospirillum sp. MES TaxID=1565314 RepID=UPI000543A674|nr:hypothetical protein [Sulfurospirillum sp. MES]KHG32973.1 MAG: hypothetical protein OA34_12300 [Sulfurospirillum sp. MES]
MKLAVINLSRRRDVNAVIYGALLGFVFTSIIAGYVLIKQQIDFDNFLKFVASVEWVPGEHSGLKK